MSFFTGVGGWIADMNAAHARGESPQECAWCGNWTWWNPNDLTPETKAAGRVFCTRKGCEIREHVERHPEDLAAMRKSYGDWPEVAVMLNPTPRPVRK